MRTLLGTASLGCALLLFFGLRALAHMGLRKIGLANRFVWLVPKPCEYDILTHPIVIPAKAGIQRLGRPVYVRTNWTQY